MRIDSRLAVKASIATIVLIVCIALTSVLEPVVGAKFAVEQLKDDYSSNAEVKLWLLFKNNWLTGYVLFVLLLFANNIKNLFTREK